jgi:flavin reductase (DIM6/NTAB) family NADH-FMN oxidoreductase RutF
MNDNPRRLAPRPEIDPHLFRRVMGGFATGVTVVTVRDGTGVRGMTANAFMSGSLEPPLCVVSVAKRARMHALLLRAGFFGVSILAEHQESLSDHFSGRPNPAIEIRFLPGGPAPLLAETCGRITAEVVARHDCGDHTLFIGHILDMEAEERPPLIYHSGRYTALDQERAEHDVAVPEFW